MKTRLLYITTCGLVLAAIVHICIVFFIPFFGEKDAARRIMQKSGENQFEVLETAKYGQTNADPFFKLAVCKFNLSVRGIQLASEKTDLFWSASVFSARGRVIYSLNERTAIGNQLRMVVVNPIQMANIRQIQPEELETSIVVETGEQTGFVIIRALLQDPSWEQTVDEFLNNLDCLPYSGLE